MRNFFNIISLRSSERNGVGWGRWGHKKYHHHIRFMLHSTRSSYSIMNEEQSVEQGHNLIFSGNVFASACLPSLWCPGKMAFGLPFPFQLFFRLPPLRFHFWLAHCVTPCIIPRQGDAWRLGEGSEPVNREEWKVIKIYYYVSRIWEQDAMWWQREDTILQG